MAIHVYWASGSPYSWRALLALEFKGLSYVSHQLQLSKQEHKSPQMLVMTPRGRLPVVKHDDYVVFESLAILYYLDLKYPDPPLFGRSPEEAGVIMRVIEEYQAYAEEHLMNIVESVFRARGAVLPEEITDAMHVVASEARTIEARLSTKGDWIVGEAVSAADLMIYPSIELLLRALAQPVARELSARFLPIHVNYPALGRWLERMQSLPGFDRTYPPHWRESV